MDKHELGWLLLILAVGQLIVAIRIGKINRNRTDKNDDTNKIKLKKLNTLSRAVQVFALITVLIFIFFKG